MNSLSDKLWKLYIRGTRLDYEDGTSIEKLNVRL